MDSFGSYMVKYCLSDSVAMWIRSGLKPILPLLHGSGWQPGFYLGKGGGQMSPPPSAQSGKVLACHPEMAAFAFTPWCARDMLYIPNPTTPRLVQALFSFSPGK